MTKTRSGDEEDNQNMDGYSVIDYNWGFSTGTLRHMPNLVTRVSDVDEHSLMFANLGWEARKHLNPNGGRWPEIIKCYAVEKEEHSVEYEVMIQQSKRLAHLMFNT